jgi:hypothetical protein
METKLWKRIQGARKAARVRKEMALARKRREQGRAPKGFHYGPSLVEIDKPPSDPQDH